jgi:hypothetical protein
VTVKANGAKFQFSIFSCLSAREIMTNVQSEYNQFEVSLSGKKASEVDA